MEYVEPVSIIINKVDSNEIGYHIELNCAWEESHGLEWTIKNEKVVYVGEFYDEPASNSEEQFKSASWNYINKI